MCVQKQKQFQSLHVITKAVFAERSHGLAGKTSFGTQVMVRVHLAAECDMAITKGASSQWKLNMPLVMVI